MPIFDSILSLFGSASTTVAPGAKPDVRDAMVRRMQVATCVLLLELAMADDEFTTDERTQIVDILRVRFRLSEDEARELLGYADQARAASSDLWKFTNIINQSCTRAEKIDVMKEIWRVVYSDDALHGHEDHLAHKAARLLNLPHGDLIEAKMAILSERRSS